MNKDVVLLARGLTKRFGDHRVLRGIDLQLSGGEIYALLGANGAGKTTAINIITGLLPPDAGEVQLSGAHAEGQRAAVGVAPQDIALYPRLTCAENLAFFGGLFGIRGAGLHGRVDSVIELARLSDYRDARAATLSGGTRRRLNLGVAMIHEPKLLILDEPTAGLDIEARYGLWETIRGFRASGTGVLLTTHLLDEAAALSDRIAVLHDGRIAREGTLAELCATVPAAQIAEVESEHEGRLRARAAALGLRTRSQAGRLKVLLPQPTTLEALIHQLRGAGVRAISLRSVGLEDVFFHVTGRDSAKSGPTSIAGHPILNT